VATVFGQSTGSLALDFVNTVDWRDDPARRVDLIPTATALAAWTRHAGFPVAAGTWRRPERHHRAIGLRETLAALFGAATKHRRLPEAALAELTRWNQDAWRQRVLTSRQKTAAWRWRARANSADRLLFTIALDAADLLLSADRSRLRVCEGAGCGWFFFDRSKAGRRRWCNMEVCGNRVKVRSYRSRVSHG
jgi:predicted RNA-binding Zn ribbon-like protein